MSTVLEALRQLEGEGKPGSRLPEPGPRRRTSLWIAISLVALGMGAAAIVAFVVPREAPRPSPVEAPGPNHAAVALDPPPAVDRPPPAERQARVPPVVARAGNELPWGQVRPRSAPAATTVPARPAKQRAEPAPARSGGGEARARSAPDEAAMPAGGPQLMLRSIDCSGGEHACRARFLIDGRLVSLGTGESSGGVEVQLVLKDLAYIQRGGTVIALQPPPR